MKDLIEAMKLMTEVGFTDQDIVRLLSSCDSQETAIEFAQFCVDNKLVWNNLEGVKPDKTLISFKSGGQAISRFIFNPRKKDITKPFKEQMTEKLS